MDEGSYEARKSGDGDRIEVTVRTERRRRWSAEEKLRIVRETLRPGAVAQVVADRNGIGTGQLYTWRKQMLTAAITGFAAVETVAEPRVAPRLTASSVASDPSPAVIAEVAIEVELPNGARVRVGNGAGASLLCDVFAALDRR
jgi:transposase